MSEVQNTAQQNIARPLKQYSAGDKKPLRIGYLIWMNFLGVGGAAALFVGIWYADFLSSAFSGTLHFFQRHEVLMSLTAAMPFFATILVGMGYAKRGIAKKRAREANEAREQQQADAASREARGPIQST